VIIMIIFYLLFRTFSTKNVTNPDKN